MAKLIVRLSDDYSKRSPATSALVDAAASFDGLNAVHDKSLDNGKLPA
jgi:hypothetical protein